MTPAKEHDLIERFPGLLGRLPDRVGSGGRFEHGDGWYAILAGLATRLEKLLDAWDSSKDNATLHDSYFTIKTAFFADGRIFVTPADLADQPATPGRAKATRADFHFVQIKEKFGTLRVYVKATTLGMREAIRGAVVESASTCETCGSAGELRKTSREMMMIRCPACWEALREGR